MSTKVLLADDSMTAQNIGKKILTDAGFDVIAVSNGAQALKKIPEHAPDIVILDVYMPGYSGLEVCEKLRNAEFTAKLPVVLTVGKMEPYRNEDGERVKADGVIIKPFEATDLIAVVTKLVASAAPAVAATPAPVAAVEAPTPIDVQYDTDSILSQDFGDVAIPAQPFTRAEIPANAAAFSPEDLLGLAGDDHAGRESEPVSAAAPQSAETFEDPLEMLPPQFGAAHVAVPDAFAAAAELTVAKEEEVPLSVPMLDMTAQDEPFFAAPAFVEEHMAETLSAAMPAQDSAIYSRDTDFAALEAHAVIATMDPEPVMAAVATSAHESDNTHDFLMELNSFLPAPIEPASAATHDDAHALAELDVFAEQGAPVVAGESHLAPMPHEAAEAEPEQEQVVAAEEPVGMHSYISAIGNAPAMVEPVSSELEAAEMAVPVELSVTEIVPEPMVEVAEPTIEPELPQLAPQFSDVAPIEGDEPTAPLLLDNAEAEPMMEIPVPSLVTNAAVEISGLPCSAEDAHAHAAESLAEYAAVACEPTELETLSVVHLAEPEPSRMCCSATQPGEPEAHLSVNVPIAAVAAAQAISPENIQLVSGVVARVIERMLPAVLEQVLAEMNATRS